MTKEEIIVGNKLIASFMGGVADNQKEWVTINKKLVRQYLYHYSWDRLFPVLERIESLGFSICLESRNNSRHRCVISNMPFFLADRGDGSRPWINSVWKSVIDFIKWYNAQKQRDYKFDILKQTNEYFKQKQISKFTIRRIP
jgi:hypothetical protein